MAETIGQQIDAALARLIATDADHERRIAALEKGKPPIEPPIDPPPGEFTPPPLASIEWHDQNISKWSEASRIDESRAEWRSGRQYFPHTKAGQWPTYDSNGPVEGNPWCIWKMGGKWHAMTYEWVRPNQVEKGLTVGNFRGHLSYHSRTPEGWHPGMSEGGWCGWLVSAIARHGRTTGTYERSQIVWRQGFALSSEMGLMYLEDEMATTCRDPRCVHDPGDRL